MYGKKQMIMLCIVQQQQNNNMPEFLQSAISGRLIGNAAK